MLSIVPWGTRRSALHVGRREGDAVRHRRSDRRRPPRETVVKCSVIALSSPQTCRITSRSLRKCLVLRCAQAPFNARRPRKRSERSAEHSRQSHSAHHTEHVTIHYPWHPLHGQTILVQCSVRHGRDVWLCEQDQRTAAIPVTLARRRGSHANRFCSRVNGWRSGSGRRKTSEASRRRSSRPRWQVPGLPGTCRGPAVWNRPSCAACHASWL